jgi:FkbM family methyltransferase
MAIFSLYDLFPDPSPIRILDVGALDDPNAPPPYAALVAAGRAHLVGFEPNPAGFLTLTRKYGPPHRFFPAFAGGGGPATFHKTQLPDASSLLRPNTEVLELFNDLPSHLTVVEALPVDTVRIDDVPEIGDIDYVKIDVQGAEIEVFRGAQTALAGAVVVHTEISFVELYERQPLFADVDQYLRGQGFWFHTITPITSLCLKPLRAGAQDAGLNQRVWADAVYTAHPLRLAALATDKLRKMAALLHDVYRSYDVAFRCLQALDARDGATRCAEYLARMTRP